MGRTIPSFRTVLEMEKAEWKPFRNAIPKSEKKQFDEMFDIPRLYLSACSNSVQLVQLHPIIISILLHHHYKELKECISEVEQMYASGTTDSSSRKIDWLRTTKEKGEEKQEEQKEESASVTDGSASFGCQWRRLPNLRLIGQDNSLFIFS